jgi:hypothetical protein
MKTLQSGVGSDLAIVESGRITRESGMHSTGGGRAKFEACGFGGGRRSLAPWMRATV